MFEDIQRVSVAGKYGIRIETAKRAFPFSIRCNPISALVIIQIGLSRHGHDQYRALDVTISSWRGAGVPA
jgi:hypothetical protein